MISIYYSPKLDRLVLISYLEYGIRSILWDYGDKQLQVGIFTSCQMLLNSDYRLIGAFYEN